MGAVSHGGTMLYLLDFELHPGQQPSIRNQLDIMFNTYMNRWKPKFQEADIPGCQEVLHSIFASMNEMHGTIDTCHEQLSTSLINENDVKNIHGKIRKSLTNTLVCLYSELPKAFLVLSNENCDV